MNTFCFKSPPVFNRLSPRPTRPRLLNIYMISVFKKPLTCVLKSNSNNYEYLAAIAALTRLRFLPKKKKLRAHILFQTVHRVCQSPMQYSYIDHSGPLFLLCSSLASIVLLLSLSSLVCDIFTFALCTKY